MSAPDHSSQTLAAVLEGYTRVIKALAGEYGMQVCWQDLGPHTAGRYDGPARTVTINSAAPLDTQCWVAHQAVTACMFGESAVPAARRARHLRPVN